MTIMEWMICLLAAGLMLAFGISYGKIREQRSLKRRALFFKGNATLMAVLLAFYYALRSPGISAFLIALGILLCMAADVLLEVRFIAGVAAFGGAHVCFIAGFSLKCLSGLWTLFILWLFLYIGMAFLHRRFLRRLKQLTLPGFIYAALLCGTCAVSVWMFLTVPSAGHAAAALGGIFFYLSDNILAYCTLARRRSKKSSAVLLGLYFSGIYLLAVSQYL